MSRAYTVHLTSQQIQVILKALLYQLELEANGDGPTATEWATMDRAMEALRLAVPIK